MGYVGLGEAIGPRKCQKILEDLVNLWKRSFPRCKDCPIPGLLKRKIHAETNLHSSIFLDRASFSKRGHHSSFCKSSNSEIKLCACCDTSTQFSGTSLICPSGILHFTFQNLPLLPPQTFHLPHSVSPSFLHSKS